MRRARLAGMVLAAALSAGNPVRSAGARAARPWWLDEPVATSWTLLAEPDQRQYLAYLKECGSRVADRALYLGHLSDPKRPQPGQHERESARFLSEHGLRWTTFFSVEGWDPAPDSVAQMVEELKRHVELGADGVHLDLLNNPKTETGAAKGFARLRDDLHAYAAGKGRSLMVTGNVWLLDTPFTVRAAKVADVAWVESYGRDETEQLRLLLAARAIGEDRKPVWCHLQPDYDEDGRVAHLTNLPRSLYASCLFADGVFLGNYQYPVFVTTGPERDEEFFGKRGKWKTIPTNPGWRQSVIRYSRFARGQAALAVGARTEAPVLVTYRPEQVREANAMMARLVRERVPFQSKVYGKDFFPPLTRNDLRRSTAILSPDRDGTWPAGARGFTDVASLLSATRAERERFLRIQGGERVLGRVTVSSRRRLLHLKQTGYSEKEDSLRQTGALQISMYAPGVNKGYLISPDLEGKTPLTLHRQGDQVRFQTPGVRFYALVVLE